MKGKVVRLVADRGFGFIKGEDNTDYFFHSSGIRNGKFPEVYEGQEVEFEPTSTQKGTRAEQIYLL